MQAVHRVLPTLAERPVVVSSDKWGQVAEVILQYLANRSQKI